MRRPTGTEPPVVTEVPLGGALPVRAHPGWRERWPWLLQGTTARGSTESPFDLGWFGEASTGAVQRRWSELRAALGVRSVVHAPQVHGAAVRIFEGLPPGIHRAEACDGYVVPGSGVLAAVTVADCVPVWLVQPERRVAAVLHAGWRGIAAGVLERGVGVLAERLGIEARTLHAHFGPSICGDCYEVGPEVHERLEQPVPPGPAPIDLRAILGGRALRLGLLRESLSTSGHCTLHGELFFSHRGGDSARQVAFVGVR